MELSIYLVPFFAGVFGGAIFTCIKGITDVRKFYTFLALLILGTHLVDLSIQGLNTFASTINAIFCLDGLFILIGFFPGGFIGRRLASYYKTGEFFE